MQKESLSIKFFPRPGKDANQLEFTIYCRITINRKKLELSTRQKLASVDDWDPVTQRVIAQKNKINSSLATFEANISQAYNKLLYTQSQVSCNDLKRALFTKTEASPRLLSFLQDELDSLMNDNQLTANTKKNYRATFNHVEDFILKSKRSGLLVSEVDKRFILDFDNYLLSKKIHPSSEATLCRTSANKYQIKLKRMLNAAIEQKFLKEHPYKKVKFKEVPSTRTFLTSSELKMFEEHDLGGNDSLIRVRDIFIFSVYTGLRFSDASALKDENLEFDGVKYWIVFRQQKTQEFSRLPLLTKAFEICEKYKGSYKDYLLPRISNQKVNLYLKTIANLVGIKKKITHHVARHTNATTVFLSNGVPLEIVNKQLGHKSIKTTQIYAKITNEVLLRETNKLDEILNARH